MSVFLLNIKIHTDQSCFRVWILPILVSFSCSSFPGSTWLPRKDFMDSLQWCFPILFGLFRKCFLNLHLYLLFNRLFCHKFWSTEKHRKLLENRLVSTTEAIVEIFSTSHSDEQTFRSGWAIVRPDKQITEKIHHKVY